MKAKSFLPKRTPEEYRKMAMAYAVGAGPEEFNYRKYMASEDWLSRVDSLTPEGRKFCSACHCSGKLELAPKHPLMMGRERKCDVHLLCELCFKKWLGRAPYLPVVPRKRKIGFRDAKKLYGKGAFKRT